MLRVAFVSLTIYELISKNDSKSHNEKLTLLITHNLKFDEINKSNEMLLRFKSFYMT